MPYRPYREYNKPARKPKPQPKPRVRGPLTPAKPCVIVQTETGLPIVFEKTGGGFHITENGPEFTVFPSRIKAKAALWHICEWLKSAGQNDHYEVVRYDA